jgi:hypothetical protein
MPPSSDIGPRGEKVFGVGWAKTGVTTLAGCLRTLGFNHYGQNLSLVPQVASGDLTKAMRLAATHDSLTDWPWIAIYRDLDRAFPGSKFVLTTRDPDRWLKSYLRMLAAEGPPTEAMLSFRRILYGFDVADAPPQQLRDRYCRHQAAVLEHFRGREGDLLVVDWELGHGWKELCDFIGLPSPAGPFPHLNRHG